MPTTPETLPPIAVDPIDLAKMPQATRATARALYEGKGYPKEQTLAAFPDVEKGKAAPPPTGYSGLSHGQVEAGYQAAWNANPSDEVLRAAMRDGVTIKGKDGKPIIFNGEAAAPDAPAYTALNFTGLPHVADMPPDDLAAFNAEFVGVMTGVGVPQIIAQQAVEAFVKTADEAPEDEEEALRRYESEGTTIKGLADGPEIIRLAAVADKALKERYPDWYQSMTEAFAFHSAASQLALAAIGRQIEGIKR
jgi:hypothetical protein